MIQKIIIIITLFMITPGMALSQNNIPDPKKIPTLIVSLDSEGEDSQYALIVQKETQELSLFESHSRTFEEKSRLTCSTGMVRGAKRRAGDNKTPEGVYFFIKIHEKKELAPIYGIRAFPTDYPNLLDQIAELTGNAIWLHGTNKPLKPRDSHGCVALEDTDVNQLTPYITLNRTPIIITKKFSYEPFDPAIRQSLRDMLSNWNTVVQTGTYHDYVQFYDADYVPDITWWNEWNKIRKSFQKSGETFSVHLQKISLIRYDNIYVALFDQIIRFSDKDELIGTKKFFIRYKDQQFRIIGEEYQISPQKTKKEETPFIVAARDLKQKQLIAKQEASSNRREDNEAVIDDPEVAKMIDQWLKAWSSKDVDEYGNYYASDFQSRGMNKSAWLAYKKSLNRKYKYIQVSKQDKIQVKEDGEKRKVSFTQHYKSDRFKSVSTKYLILKNENGEWKIYRETSRRR